MSAMRFALAFVLVLSASIPTADAQQRRSSWEADTSMGFEGTLEPAARAGTAETCRDICLKDERCTGWTYDHSEVIADRQRENSEPPRGTCVKGTGTTTRNSQKAPGLTSGMIRAVPPCAPQPGAPPGYVC
jgi:hypothetical protein